MLREPLSAAVLSVALPLGALLPQSAGSAVIHVPTDEPTVQAGLDEAAPGDTVLVACGTYHEHDIRLASGVTLRGTDGSPDCVVIDAQAAGRVLFAQGLAAGARVEAITIKNGRNRDAPVSARESPGPESIDEDASALRDGMGGGGGAYLLLSSVTFRDCVFDSNVVWTNGGGVRCEGGAAAFERCTFRGNRASYRGGALYLGPGTRAVLADCEIAGNVATWGAGAYVAVADTFSCTGSAFLGNTSRSGPAGLHTSFCNPVVDGCTFVANVTSGRGGAMAIFGGTATISGTTIALNRAPLASGLRVHTATVDVSRSIIAMQERGGAIDCTSGIVNLDCCDVWGNPGGDYLGCIAGQEGIRGNFSVDPLFCAWPSRDVGLLHDSPCLPRNNDCGILIGSEDRTECGNTVPVLLRTDPRGLVVDVNGHEGTGPYGFRWVPGTQANLGTTSPQMPAPGERHTFVDWSDGGAMVHPVTAPDSSTTFRATFDTEYRLVLTAAAGGTVAPADSTYHAAETEVTVTAEADSGYGFVRWVGTGRGSYNGTDNPVTVRLGGPITQHAEFEVVEHVVTMAADPGGSVRPRSGDHVYVDRTVVVITAIADSAWKFADWTGVGHGSYTGAANPAQITVLGPITQTAHFTPLPIHVLTMNADPGGTVSPPTGQYVEGTSVAITAMPSPGFVFRDWTGTGSGSYTGPNNPATVTVNGPITQTAHFLPLFRLTMAADSGGTVTPPTGDFPQGSVVTIQATALPNREFTGWSGTGPGSYTGPDNPATVTMNGPISQTAHFWRPPTFPLTTGVAPTGGGSVQPPSGEYPNGSQVQITAVADSGYSMTLWIGSGNGSYTGYNATATITMNGPITQTAHFNPVPKVTLTMVAKRGGSVFPSSGEYLLGSSVRITAVPDSGNAFADWFGQGYGSYSGPDSSVTITLGGNVKQTATFDYDVPVTVSTPVAGWRIGADGSDYPSPWTFSWRRGTRHTVDVDSIVPGGDGDRHRFSAWSDGVGTVARTIDVPDSAVSYSAAYAPDYFLDFVDPPEGVGLPGPGWHAGGTGVTIEAVPNPGYVFSSWSGVGNGSYTGTDNPAAVTMNGPIVQTSVYESYGYEFSISASATDPFVNVRSPTGGPSSLYLWMTCTDLGISFLEADVLSTMPYDAFTPVSGVTNYGGPGNLLLWITGCPGVDGPFLAGTMSVVDSGGELCLVPSAANGHISAVSCGQPPIVVDPVRLTGFSSSSQPPCFVAGYPCLGPAALPEPGADHLAREPGAGGNAPRPVPAADLLGLARPNPFRGRTALSFAIAGAGRVRLSVYDVTGRLVRRLVDRPLAPGEHRVVWDSRAGDGPPVPAGLYFVRLEIGDRRFTRKIVLLESSR